MLSVFNEDLRLRLADLHAALRAGEQISVRFLAEFASQPDRLNVSFGNRLLVFDLPMAKALADQLAANGDQALAEQIRAALGKAA